MTRKFLMIILFSISFIQYLHANNFIEVEESPRLGDQAPAVCRNTMTLNSISNLKQIETDKEDAYLDDILYYYDSPDTYNGDYARHYNIQGSGLNYVLSIDGSKLKPVLPGERDVLCGDCKLRLKEVVSYQTKIENRRIINPRTRVSANYHLDSDYYFVPKDPRLNISTFIFRNDKMLQALSCASDSSERRSFKITRSSYKLVFSDNDKRTILVDDMTLKQFQDQLAKSVQSCPALKISYLPDTKTCKEVRIGVTGN